ncbi:MAG: Gfo/Idh/MocA family oxidoreductase [Gemmatimonadetes bacterium]|nr:Gfo/Idh/MocA family oxidoreductase [Gemmatimonadota bacterium]MYD25273.1 Gfo/Idh/MocA family oxidoreductase [Gemmatimonadota bacterium]MYJ00047.1 Gfo/Idh/MocA family oxidoreductase [Gemmatimonadota bacterium]
MAIRMAQYGTGHGHAAGKLQSMSTHPDVECVGVYEPDAGRRSVLEHADGPYADVRWFDHVEDMLGDPAVVAVASEGRNDESLAQTEEIVRAGKHAWYDKPAGDDWPGWQRVVGLAEKADLQVQMGYMFRYHDGFRKIADWARSGMLGSVFSIRAHMSTNVPVSSREVISAHRGGIFYDLAGHMLDQVVWTLGRPSRVTAFLRNETGEVPAFADNGLGVFEYEHAMATVDIAAMEPSPPARRYEVYGTEGSAILLEPFEPGTEVRLVLAEAREGYPAGESRVPVEGRGRQALYDLELASFLKTITGKQPPDRPLSHELLVQETLLRATRGLS